MANANDPNAALLATIQRNGLSIYYADQKAELEKYFASIGNDIFVASYGLFSTKNAPDDTQSWCAWTEGVRALLPTTEWIAFVQDPNGTKKSVFVPRTAAESIVGHHLIPTTEDPPRVRVESFPTPEELAELQKHKMTT